MTANATPQTPPPQHYGQPAAILLAALVLGIAANYLFWPEGPADAAAALATWLLLFCATASSLCWHQQVPWRGSVVGLAAVVAAAALLLLLRDLDVLLLALLGILFAAALQIVLRTAGIGLLHARISHYVRAALALPLQVVLGVLPLLAALEIRHNWHNPRGRSITRGLLLALPPLVLFVALFASADAGFSRYVPSFDSFFNSDTPAHLLLILVFFVISGGLLAGALKTRTLAAIEVPAGKLGAEETGIVLGLLSALFVVFVVFQLRYLFGGQEAIATTTGLTLAQYARRGFFELLWVAIFTLGLLLAVASLSRAAHLLRLFGSLMVGCVLIMLVSAAQRMLLYIDNFGLSVDRVVACTAMAWIASCLLLCALTVLRGRERGFAAGMVNLGIVFCLALIALNPGKLVATVNVERALTQQQPLDVYYLRRLGADVVAPLLARFDELPATTQCEVANALIQPWPRYERTSPPPDPTDWRNWNYSRQQARELINANREKLQTIVDNDLQRALQNADRQPGRALLPACQ